ncbi:LOW QUALITY PROTEIN: DDB1- and CUL4-associated factor 1 [Lethenteron reissneri]|uniref:LOW QUALITY PROTEIN: DDB1- and CUL4-associated factor 1 n=1 Tax=Lethenteron reissneri TaxID=7753 RepID=UPI002AB6A585|nr:LOW QUALITY PROTEIN: DDB1- and CUL4-associated factor 1 [Lethenteron reissneri]
MAAAAAAAAAAATAAATAAAATAAAAIASTVDSKAELGLLLEQWEREKGTGADPIPLLSQISDLIERETEEYHKADPDPFDDRHPGRADPECMLGHLLKMLFKSDDFMNALVNAYMMTSREPPLNTAACRLLLNILPGLETSVVFQEKEGIVENLFKWARDAAEPLRSYAMGLLAAAMEIQDIAANYRDDNCRMVPLALTRLRELCSSGGGVLASATEDAAGARGAAAPAPRRSSLAETTAKRLASAGTGGPRAGELPFDENAVVEGALAAEEEEDCELLPRPPFVLAHRTPSAHAGHKQRTSFSPFETERSLNELSNSSWSETSPWVIGTSYRLLPLTASVQQRVIFQYLTPLGEYQELLAMFMQLGARELLMHYIDLRETNDTQLTYEALKYLASLLLHKKFAAEFVAEDGVQKLLEVPRPSMAATGVSLCLYYLAYNQDAMERVCTLPDAVLSDLVSYALWLLECSHESGRCHATMFFSISFSFRTVLDLFDSRDGLRRLINLVSTLEILNLEDQGALLSDDEIFASRQTARHTCLALRRYFQAHLALKGESVRRSLQRTDGGPVIPPQPPYKALVLSHQQVLELQEFLVACGPTRLYWEAAEALHRLGGVPLLLQLVSFAAEWRTYYGRSETVRSALDVLAILTVVPKTQVVLAEPIDVLNEIGPPIKTIGMNIVLKVAEGEVFLNEAEIQKSALQVVINCVCGPDRRPPSLGRFVGGTPRRRTAQQQQQGSRSASTSATDNVLSKMWGVVRANNGIKVLLALLSVKAPITDADQIRALACRALVGLSRSATVRQIISKLPLFCGGHMQMLMREPVLQDKRQEHVRFCRFASQLLERVSGKPMSAGGDVSLARLQRADVVAQTRITFPGKELLLLIRNHLQTHGLPESAAALTREADLPRGPLPPPPLPPPPTPTALTAPPQPASFSPAAMALPPGGGACLPRAPRLVNGLAGRATAGGTRAPAASSSSGLGPSQATAPPPPSSSQSGAAATAGGLLSSPGGGPSHGALPGTPSGAGGALGRISFSKERLSPCAGSAQRKAARVLMQKADCGAYVQSPAFRKELDGRPAPSPPALDGIITEYLREQHSRCKNPIVTCPPFSLFTPHQCPEPKQRQLAPFNFTSRLTRRAHFPMFGGTEGASCDRQLIFSRFRPLSVFRESDEDGSCFTCCAFSARERFLMLGTYTGELKLYNLYTGQEEASYACHSSPVTHCEPSRDGQLLLTSSDMSRPLSALWGMKDVFDLKHGFDNDHYVEFSKLCQDRIIGTENDTARIYDVQTGVRTETLYNADLANHYKRNCATFSPTDELVLNDGVLWDVRSAQAVHKFDKFNMNISGVFHPNGLEIIINTEIWDLRTFHLLHTVPALDHCSLVFNHAGTVIYGAMLQPDDEDELMEEQMKSPFGSSFRTFNATDYKPIATIDVKKNIFDLCTDTKDCYLAVIENQKGLDSLSMDSVCRLYEVGRQRLAEEEEEEEEQEDEEEDEDDSEDDALDLDEFDSELDDEDEEGAEAGDGVDGDEEVGETRRENEDGEEMGLSEGDGADDEDDDEDGEDDEVELVMSDDSNDSDDDSSDLEDDMLLALNQ